MAAEQTRKNQARESASSTFESKKEPDSKRDSNGKRNPDREVDFDSEADLDGKKAFDGERAFTFLKKISFPRLGGSRDEERAANLILGELAAIGLKGEIEEFDVWTYANAQASVEVLEPYRAAVQASAVGLSGNTPVEGLIGEVKYVESGSPDFLQCIEGKILLSSGHLGLESFKKAREKGALGAIIILPPARDFMHISTPPDYFERFGKLPSAFIRYEDGLALLKNGATKVKLTVTQEESRAKSRNIIAEIRGTEAPDEIILVGAHFDSVPLTQGAHDNGAGSATIMEMARYFAAHPPKRTVRFVWFGSEELGLIGSQAYVEKRKDEMKDHKFMVNIDVAGGIIGTNSASVMAPDKIMHYLDVMGKVKGIGLNVRQSIYSGDCIPLGDKEVPSVTFARGGGGAFHLHSPGDSLEHIDAKHLEMLGRFILEFTDEMVNSAVFPVEKEIPASIKKSVKEYLEKSLGKPGKEDQEEKKDDGGCYLTA